MIVMFLQQRVNDCFVAFIMHLSSEPIVHLVLELDCFEFVSVRTRIVVDASTDFQPREMQN